MTLSQALIGETIAPRERARYQGYLAAVVVFSNSFGPIAGGWLTQAFGWRSVFWLNLAVGAACPWEWPFACRLKAARQDSLGTSMRPASFSSFSSWCQRLLVLEGVRDVSLGDVAASWSGMADAIAAVSAWLAGSSRKSREASPLLPVSVWQMPAIWRSDALAACHGAALVSLITYVPIYLHVVRGVSATETGYILLPVAIGIGVGSLVTGPSGEPDGAYCDFPVFWIDPGQPDVAPGWP